MNARDIMSKPVVSVHSDTSTREIARLLLDKGISSVPVVVDLLRKSGEFPYER
jgi:CBS domain-containing protein